MSGKKGLFALILSILALALAAASLILVCTQPKPAEPVKTDTQYVLYLGTNDKDTNQPVFSHEEARENAEKILLDHFGGYTIQEADGGWIDGETVYTEYTLVIYLSDTDLEHVHAAADQMLRVFNQSSVLIQANQTVTEFYSGAD